MKDTHETNLPAEEIGKLEEAKAPVATPEKTAEESVTNEIPKAEETTEETSVVKVDIPLNTTDGEDSVVKGKLSKEGIIEKLAELVNAATDVTRNEVDALKQAYYKLHRNEVDELKKAFLENGGEEKDFVPPVDETESRFKELLTAYKEKRAAILAEEEREKAANYAQKLQLIDQLKELTESQDDFNKLHNKFKEIQQRWKEIKLIPQEYANELWKNYQMYSEKFYDIIKINNQFRDYDFKKNLELKTALCETVEKLETEPDVVSAFHQLQKLHQQWREIGPVAKELREDLWARFKAASTVINKRHQAYFEALKAKEKENLEAKTAICEQLESIDFTSLKSFKDWEDKNKEVIALQEKWKTIGFAPKKFNVKIFGRFRAACDAYFKQKGEFYKRIKSEMEKNLELKKALCEKVEALKDSTDWKNTTDKLIALQKEWKTIGPVARKHSDAIWRRFISACDYFFEQKNKNVTSQKSIEQANLEAKKALIKKINAMDETDYTEAMALLKEFMSEWNVIGHVPFKEKDKIYKEYHEAVDKQFDRLQVDQNDRKMQMFRNNLTDIGGKERGGNRIYSERERLMRQYERMKNELQTYENNMGFLNISTKSGDGLIKEMERKIKKLKDDMELVVKKVETIDETLE